MIHEVVCYFTMVAPVITLHQLYAAASAGRLLLLLLSERPQESQPRSLSCAGLFDNQIEFGPSIDVE